MILDSGERREFESGAVRDANDEKGRTDLLPLDVVSVYMNQPILACIEGFVRRQEPNCLYQAIRLFARDNGWDDATAMLEVSIHYAEGCKKYKDRNWELGIPLHCFIDSGVRHYLKWLRGDTDESHSRAFLWNMLGALWTLRNKPELNDLPNEKSNL